MEPPAKRQKRPTAAPPAPATASSPESDGRSFHLTKLRDAPLSHNAHAVGLDELLSGDFSRCLLTNYMFDLEWLMQECPRLANVPIVLVHGERDRQAMARSCAPYTNVTVVAPPLPIPYGTHHTKMFVAVYPDKVRVAVFTANFISIDWNNKTQGVWHQDFGLKVLQDDDEDDSKPASDHSMQPDFEADLVAYLSTLGAPVSDFCRELRRFDFSTARVALVPSVPGAHRGRGMAVQLDRLIDCSGGVDDSNADQICTSTAICVFGGDTSSRCRSPPIWIFDRTVCPVFLKLAAISSCPTDRPPAHMSGSAAPRRLHAEFHYDLDNALG